MPKIIIDMPDERAAMALAQMCKRTTYETLQRLSADGREHADMEIAIIALEGALRAAGFNPR